MKENSFGLQVNATKTCLRDGHYILAPVVTHAWVCCTIPKARYMGYFNREKVAVQWDDAYCTSCHPRLGLLYQNLNLWLISTMKRLLYNEMMPIEGGVCTCVYNTIRLTEAGHCSIGWCTRRIYEFGQLRSRLPGCFFEAKKCCTTAKKSLLSVWATSPTCTRLKFCNKRLGRYATDTLELRNHRGHKQELYWTERNNCSPVKEVSFVFVFNFIVWKMQKK